LRKSSTSRWKGELVAIASPALHLAGIAEKVSRLADEVERQVGEAEIDLDRRRVPAPLRQALTEDEAVVAEPKRIFEQRKVRILRRWRIEDPSAVALPGVDLVLGAIGAATASDVLDVIGYVVEGRVPGRSCPSAGSNMEASSLGSEATIEEDGTTQRLTPSIRRV
jgi:hypothetical protein